MGFLRLFLALVVLVSHFAHIHKYHMLISGGLAVRVFYLISGFYIQLIISQYEKQSRWKRKFYLSRLLRIFPAYYVMFVLTALYYGTSCNTFCTSMVINGAVPSLLFYYFSNFFILGQDVSRFLTYHYSSGLFSFDPLISRPDYWVSNMQILHQSWSIAIELEFYLLAPFLLRLRSRQLIIIAALAFAVRRYLASIGYSHPDNWYNSFFPSALHAFVLGALAARLAMDTVRLAKYRVWLAIAGMTFLLLWSNLESKQLPSSDTTFLWGIFCLLPLIFKVSEKCRADRWVGALSYPVYLNHLLMIEITGRYIASPAPHLACAIAMSLALAILIVSWVEQPVTVFRHRHFRAPAAHPSVKAAKENPTNDQSLMSHFVATHNFY